MREFDTAALREMARVLQTSGGPPQLVELQDELIQQSVDVNPFARRGLTPSQSVGWFTATILNTHVGSDTIFNDLDVYSKTVVLNGYPGPTVPPNWDVWLMGFDAVNVTAPGDFGGGFLGLNTNALGMGLRIGGGGGIAAINVLMYYNQESTFGNRVVLTDGISGATVWGPRPLRLKRGANQVIRFETVKSGVGAGSYLLSMILGTFPAGLGQDIVV